MPVDLSEMKSVLSAVKEKRHKREILLREVERPRQKTRLRPGADKSQIQKDLRRAFESNMRDAAGSFSSVEKDFRQGVEDRRKAIAQLAAADSPYTSRYVMLEKPYLIWALRDGRAKDSLLRDSHIESGNSWAKVFSQFGDEGSFFAHDEVNFYFRWTNDTHADAVVNVTSFLMLDGGCHAWADSGWLWNPFATWATDTYIDMRATVDLSLLEWWHQPATEPLRQADQSDPVTDLFVDGGFALWSLGNTADRRISGTYNVNYDTFRVPANRVAMFEVSLNLRYSGDEGFGWFAFDGPGHSVLCPFVQLEIISPPLATIE
jgi:hypothetical protein